MMNSDSNLSLSSVRKEPATIIISSRTPWWIFDLREFMSYRDLLWVFIWRDIKIKYKQTFLGVAWVLLQPVLSTLVFTVFFGRLAKIPSYDLPYTLFVLTGLVFWNFFSNSVNQASACFVAHSNLVKKVYFPRIILPIASVLTYVPDFLINIIFLMIVMVVFGYVPTPAFIIGAVFSFFLTGVTAVGLGSFLASINIKYRDVQYILPFFIQLLLFVTPVIYPLSIVGETNRLFMAANPITTSVELLRRIMIHQPYPADLMVISCVSAVLWFIVGVFVTKRMERSLSDIL